MPVLQQRSRPETIRSFENHHCRRRCVEPWLTAIVLFLAIPGALLPTPGWGQNASPERDDRRVDREVRETEQHEFFEKRVRPLLAKHCYDCHSHESKELRAGLWVDSREGLLTGGDSGPAIVPGVPDESLLISAVRYETFEMPPRGRLAKDEIAILERWVQDGAYWPPAEQASTVRPTEPAGFDWRSRRDSHWAWQPIAHPVPPATKNPPWIRTPIDAFILEKLDAAALTPAPPAARHHLIRRVYLDLVGLPPSADEVKAFTESTSTSAYAELVDRLLESPHFGEHWARHWMDLVRFAETCGHEFDYPLHHATEYRDYLIRAFNADVPYDQLVREHVAGDLLATPRRHAVDQTNESILGTGFWFLGEAVHAPTDVRGDEADRIDNQIDVFGKTFLGMTIACARCHDHKFDPIPTADYYALAGFLQSSRRQEAMLDPHGEIRRFADTLTELHRVGTRDVAATLQAFAAERDQRRGNWLVNRLLSSRLDGGASADKGTCEGDPATGATVQDGVLEKIEAGNAKKQLAAWKQALADPEVQDPSHVAHVLSVLLQDENDVEFAERKATLALSLRQHDQQREQVLADSELIADFDQQSWQGWTATGAAFGTGPAPIRLDPIRSTATEPQFVTPGSADSGRIAAGFQGVLRSPTFTLNHRRIHYRVNARDAQIRLIIDGYTMDVFNALLFADVTLENVSTDGQWRWVTQQHDLAHYLGHRAHIEIIDHGNGQIRVDEIRGSDDDPPTNPAHSFGRQVVDDPSVTSVEEMLRAYEGYFLTCLSAVGGGDATAEQTEAVNWLLRRHLVPVRPEAWQSWQTAFTRGSESIPSPRKVMAMLDGTAEDERIHIRGSHRNLGAEVARRAPVVIAGEDQPAFPDGSGRLYLAEQLVKPENPLVARVIVNRLWHHLMGRGIVASVDDFGVMGQSPTHPELLDWLATDLQQHNWSLKHAIRQIVLSNTYQMAAKLGTDDVEQRDPDNQLWHRAMVRRLTAEMLRDSMLACSGSLNPTQYGPSVPVHLTPFMTGRGRPSSGPLDGDGRRSVYVRVQRNFLAPLMLAFDTPAPFSTMGRRSVSNVPAQALILMNDPFVWQQAKVWAEAVCRQNATQDKRLEAIFLAALGYAPDLQQRRLFHDFIASQAAHHACETSDVKVWADVCHAVWNTKEFVYRF